MVSDGDGMIVGIPVVTGTIPIQVKDEVGLLIWTTLSRPEKIIEL